MLRSGESMAPETLARFTGEPEPLTVTLPIEMLGVPATPLQAPPAPLATGAVAQGT